MIDYRLMLTLALAACSPGAEDRTELQVEGNAAAAESGSPQSATPPANRPPTVKRLSAFTKLDDASCKLVEENKEEGPYWLRRCKGLAGWYLDWSESDLRQGLDVIAPNGRTTELELSSRVANGAFNHLGSTIEWRGRENAKPEAMIVRMSVASGAEPEKPDVSKLAVIRLVGTPCLVAIVEPGPGQNQKAREVADGSMSTCITAQ